MPCALGQTLFYDNGNISKITWSPQLLTFTQNIQNRNAKYLNLMIDSRPTIQRQQSYHITNFSSNPSGVDIQAKKQFEPIEVNVEMN